MSALAVTAASLTRLLRDRVAMFFIVALPVFVILIIGATVGGFGDFRVGVVDQGSGALGDDLATELLGSPALEVTRFDDAGSARSALRRVEIEAAVILPAGMDSDLRRGRTVTIVVLGERANTNQQAARSAVYAVVERHAGRLQAARFAAAQVGGTFEDRLGLVHAIEPAVAPVGVEVEVVDASSRYLPEGFSYSAPTMLVLFVFINALAGGAAMAQTRRLGLYARMMASPVAARTIIGGEALCYLALALMQSALIVGVGAVVFGVDWGDPLAAATLVAVWAAVGAGAGMLSGTLFRTPEQASAIGPAAGVAMGMLGGCMWPLEIVGDTMRAVGHLVPHAWAVDAWSELLSRGGTVVDIARPLLVLTGFAAALLAVATARLRHALVTPAGGG